VLWQSGYLASNLFAFYLQSDSAQDGELTLGGVDTNKYTGSISYIPLTSKTYYLVSLGGATINGNKYSTASSAIVDSGTSFLVGPTSDVANIARLAGGSYSSRYGVYVVSCLATVPPVSFTLGSGSTATTYSVPSSSWVIQQGGLCYLAIQGSNMRSPTGGYMWILGDAFMRQWYTIFDIGNSRLGFAQAAPASGTTGAPGTTTTSSGTTQSGATTTTQSPSTCTTCSVQWTVGYTTTLTSSYTTVANLVWNNAITETGLYTTSGYSISGSYSTNYLTATVTVYTHSDAVSLYNYVTSSSYQTTVTNAISSYVKGAVTVTVQPITVAQNGGQAYTDGVQSSNNSSNNTSDKWIWPVGILIGMLIGCGFAFCCMHWRMKHKEQNEKSYVKMVDFVQQ